MCSKGKVRYLGCSNFDAWQICKALWIADVNDWAPMVSVQPNYNVAIRDIEAELLPFCADQNIGVTSYSPLGAGFLTGKYTKTWTAPKGTRFDVMPDHWDIYENDTSMRRMEGLRAHGRGNGYLDGTACPGLGDWSARYHLRIDRLPQTFPR